MPSARPLRRGEHVLVRRFRTDRVGGDTWEVLVGVLDRTIAGDIVVLIRSSNRRAPATVMVQPAAEAPDGLSDMTLRARLADDAIRYRPRDDDPAEIIGPVVWFATAR